LKLEVGYLIKTYKDLDIYKEGYRLSLDIYRLTSKYPRDEIFGLTSQIRRAAVSVVLNIAEGYGRQSKDDFKRFLRISLGSNNETITLIELSKDLKYISREEYEKIKKDYDILGKKIYTLISNWK
jgi:four helix bundle protein